MNRARLAMLAVFTVTATPSVAQAAQYAICSSGCSYTSIQAAIDASAYDNDGQDTFYVYPGQYNESLTVSADAVIRAMSSSMNTVAVVGNGASPVMTVNGAATVTVQRINFSNGGGTAGIVNLGDLALQGCLISANDSDWGGIGNFGGTLSISGNSTVFDNEGYYGGGGITNHSGIVTVSNTTVMSNHGYLGGGLHNSFGAATIAASSFSNNSADTMGGAWSNHNIGGTVSVQSSSYSDNSAPSCDRYYDVASSACVN